MRIRPGFCYHGKMEDAADWAERAGLADEALGSLQRADITRGHQYFHALTPPFLHSLGLVT